MSHPSGAARPAAEAPAQTGSGAIETPCIKMCSVEPVRGVCLGCGRTLREIGAWTAFSPETRRAIMIALPDRLARIRQSMAGADAAPDTPAD